MSGTHDHDDLPLGSAALRRGLTYAVLAVGLLALIGVAVWWPRGEAPELRPGAGSFEYVDATVDSVRVEDCASLEVPDALTDCQIVVADITSGSVAGEPAEFRIYETDFDKPTLEEGDRIVLQRNADAPLEFRYSYFDLQRDPPLVFLLVLFVAIVLAVGWWKGARALAGIVVSFAVLFVFLLPSLLRGNPAVPVALAATVLIALGALYLAHGVNPATTVALVGTFASLAIIAVLAQVFVSMADLTGLAQGEAQVLRITTQALDLGGLLVAGVVVGALGVLDDVTITQVSTVSELRRANPEYTQRELFGAAVRVGRDHIASTVNTLVLAYAGASLPLLLLFLQSSQPWSRVLASEVVAVEIVRTLVGSIGLVLSVPITTALAALVVAPREDDSDPVARPRASGRSGSKDSGPPATGPKAADSTGGVSKASGRKSSPRGSAKRRKDTEEWDTFGPEEKPW